MHLVLGLCLFVDVRFVIRGWKEQCEEIQEFRSAA